MKTLRAPRLGAALLLALAACAPGEPAGKPWDRAELIGYTYETNDGGVTSSYTFRADDTVDSTFRKGDAVASPLMFWSLDDKGVLRLGPTRASQDIRWAKVEVKGDIVIVANDRGRQEYRKSKAK